MLYAMQMESGCFRLWRYGFNMSDSILAKRNSKGDLLRLLVIDTTPVDTIIPLSTVLEGRKICMESIEDIMTPPPECQMK